MTLLRICSEAKEPRAVQTRYFHFVDRFSPGDPLESAIDVMDGRSSSFGLIDVGFDIDTIAAGIKSTGAVIPPRLYMYETAGRRLFEIMAHHTLMIFIIRALAASGLGSTASVHALFVQPDLLLKLRYPAMFRSRLMVQDKLGRGEENTSAGRMDCE